MTPGPKARWGGGWVRRDVPGTLDAWLVARAGKNGVSVNEMLARILSDAMADGPAALRSVQHKADAEGLRRQLREVLGALDAANAREALAKKKAKDYAYAYRALSASMRLPGDKLRASIQRTMARIQADEASRTPRQAPLLGGDPTNTAQ